MRPDYIDPMFHSRVLGAKSRNLDTFFTDEETTRYLMKRGAEDTDISVVEGVMGYYDGLGGIDTKASAYDLAAVTGTPAVLVVDTRGMSLSALAEIKGFLTYKKESHIEGVILNRMSPMLYPEIKKQIEEELGIRVFGYVPKITELNLESRHLGLVLPDEVKELSEKFDHLAEILEKSLDIDGLIGLAKEAEALECSEEGVPEALKKVLAFGQAAGFHEEKPRIAVAKDEAFCFIYEDNLGLLKELEQKSPFFHRSTIRHFRKESTGCFFMEDTRNFMPGSFPAMCPCVRNPDTSKKWLSLSGGMRWFYVSSYDHGGYGWKSLEDGRCHRRKSI